jgi:uncharacterized membrane protein
MYDRLLVKQKIINAMLILGVVLDQTSTRIGINLFNLTETNPITRDLMAKGGWLLMDLVTLTGLILITRMLSESMDKRLIFLSRVFPLTAGAFRIFIATGNFQLIWQVLS